ncbi:MAG: hypothetical protein ACKVS6_04450 [Planctomycetota bacterium]
MQVHSPPDLLLRAFASVTAALLLVGCSDSRTVVSAASPIAAMDWGFITKLIDLGTRYEGEQPRFLLTVENRSGKDLDLVRIEKTCACVLSTVTIPAKVKNAEKLNIPIELRTWGVTGSADQVITIFSSTGEFAMAEVRVTVNPPPPGLPPEIIGLCSLIDKEITTKEYVVTFPGFSVASARTVCPEKGMKVSVINETNSIRFFVDFAIDYSRGHEGGTNLALFALLAGETEERQFVLPLRWSVKFPFEVTPNRMHFGGVKRGEVSTKILSVRILDDRAAPFRFSAGKESTTAIYDSSSQTISITINVPVSTSTDDQTVYRDDIHIQSEAYRDMKHSIPVEAVVLK